MKLVSFEFAGQAGYGTTDGTCIRPVSEAFRQTHTDLRAVLAHEALGELESGTDDTALVINDVTLLPPIPNPAKIVCVGLNYCKPYPVDGVAPPVPENIVLFGKERQTLVGHGAALAIPPGEPAESFDYEAEIAIVVGRAGRCVPVEKAMNYVAGYMAFNDGSVRDWQRHSIYAGKNFEKSSSCGPWITTVDEINAPEELALTARLNGELVQQAKASEMIYSMAEQVTYVSQLGTLTPGDIIATGSPDGTGGSRNPKRYLRAGDVVEISVSGVGTLVNPVAGDR